MSEHDTVGSGSRTTADDGTIASTLVWLLACCMMIQPLSTDLYLPSLPHIATAFRASPALVQQTLSLFLLGFASVQLFTGPLSDRLGRRPILLAGLIIFAVASIACAMAPTLDGLIFGRFVQAVGCCSVIVVARAIVNDTSPGIGGALVMARVSSIYALGPICGPLLGGYLQITFGWRAAFIVLSLIGLGLGGISFFCLPESRRNTFPEVVPSQKFIANYSRLVRAPVFWAYTLAGALSFGSIFVFLSGGAFLLINTLKVPTGYVGAFFALGAGGYWLGTMLCRRRLRSLGLVRTLRFGAWVNCLACLALPLIVASGLIHWTTYLGAQCLVMFAHGINFPCAQVGAVAPFPSSAGAAAALMGTFVMLSAFCVGVVVGFTYDGTFLPMCVLLVLLGVLTLVCNRGLGRFCFHATTGHA